tara:strand:+ start:224 stop:556 length:333 start_codon:yes stop_codon:yes gene_type:complete
MSSTFLATISLPDDLKDAWKRLPSKSGFVVNALRSLGEGSNVHLGWREDIQMCMPYGDSEACSLCMKELEMDVFELKCEYHYRLQTDPYWLMSAGQSKVARNILSRREEE